MLGSHNKEKYHCFLCDYKCEFITDLSNHMILRHKKNRHVCKKCRQVYESVEDLRKHQKSVHKRNAPDQCDGCRFVKFLVPMFEPWPRILLQMHSPLRSFYKKLEHLMCLGLILVDFLSKKSLVSK